MFRDKNYWSTLIKIAVPIALQNFISNGLNMVDVMMIGQLGDTAVAGVGLAGEVSFVLSMIAFGISSGGTIFAAQYWGKKDIPNLRKVLGVSLLVGFTVSVLFTLFAVLFPQTALRIYTEDAAVIQVGANYLRQIGWFFPMWIVSYVFAMIHRSTHNVKLPILVSVLALGLKTSLNYLLISGHFGFPALGVQGVVIATAISRTVEFSLMILLTYTGKTPLAATFGQLFHFDFAFLKRFFKTTLPVVINETIWSLGITTYSAIYAHIGTESITAYNITHTIDNLMFVLFMGIGNACAIMVGNKIGAGDEKQAYSYARLSLFVAAACGVFIGLFEIGIIRVLIGFYNVSDIAKGFAVNLLTIGGLVLWLRATNMVIFVGILRSGGDTRYALLLELCTMWGVGVPLALLGAFVFHLPIYYVYLMALADEVIKAGIGLRRVFSRRWINNLVHGFDLPIEPIVVEQAE
jgi:putative MATE family efflux protein